MIAIATRMADGQARRIRLAELAGLTESAIRAAGRAETRRAGKPRRDARGRFREATLAEMVWGVRRPSPLLAALPWKRIKADTFTYETRTKLPSWPHRPATGRAVRGQPAGASTSPRAE
jgi:hypothetical protein